MKKFCITLILLSIILLIIVFGGQPRQPKTNEEYLRIHIRARSNSPEDQAVKYAVRDGVVDFLTPIVASCTTKEQLICGLKSNLREIELKAESVLAANGANYGAKAEVRGEEFPLRVYDGLTLEAGYYDAIIIELGGGAGDNWWCVVYPPLCFTGEGEGQIRYKSKILELIENWRNNR